MLRKNNLRILIFIILLTITSPLFLLNFPLPHRTLGYEDRPVYGDPLVSTTPSANFNYINVSNGTAIVNVLRVNQVYDSPKQVIQISGAVTFNSTLITGSLNVTFLFSNKSIWFSDTLTTLAVSGMSYSFSTSKNITKTGVYGITAEVYLTPIGGSTEQLTNTSFTIYVVEPQLSVISIVQSPIEINSGVESFINLTVRNTGGATARNTNVSVTLPKGLSSLNPQLSLGSVSAGQFVSADFQVNANSSVQPGVYKLEFHFVYRDFANEAYTYNYTSTVSVSKLQTRLVLSSSSTSLYIGQILNVSIGISTIYGKPLVGAGINLYIDGALIGTITANKNGFYEFSLNTTSVDAGSHVLFAQYVGNSTTSGSNASLSFTVTLLPTTLSISAPTSVLAKQNFTITGDLESNGGGVGGLPVYLQLQVAGGWENISSTLTGRNGAFSFTLAEVENGTYTFRVLFDGNSVYQPSTSESVSVIVKPLVHTIIPQATKLTLLVNTTGQYPVNGTIVVILRYINGSAISGSNVTVTISGPKNETIPLTTNLYGVAEVRVVLIPGNYTMIASFGGTALLEPSSAKATLEVPRYPTQIWVESNVLKPVAGEPIPLYANLSAISGPLAGYKLFLYLNATNRLLLVGVYTTNTTGWTRMVVYPNTSGNFEYVVVFNGSALYSPTSRVVLLSVEQRPKALFATTFFPIELLGVVAGVVLIGSAGTYIYLKRRSVKKLIDG